MYFYYDLIQLKKQLTCGALHLHTEVLRASTKRKKKRALKTLIAIIDYVNTHRRKVHNDHNLLNCNFQTACDLES